MKKILGLVSAIIVMSVLLAACSAGPIGKAFKAKTDAGESNKILSEYCQSCHSHRNFEPEKHVPEVQKAYRNPEYSSRSECRGCHSYSKNWLMDTKRTTHWPVPKG